MHSARPVVNMIAHPATNQMISCGAGIMIEAKYQRLTLLTDLIIRIWRVYPYAVESLAVVRSIFCSLPPHHLAVMNHQLAVAFCEQSTLTHSMMLYNLENNGTFSCVHSRLTIHV
jgi:hypothetical protein